LTRVSIGHYFARIPSTPIAVASLGCMTASISRTGAGDLPQVRCLAASNPPESTGTATNPRLMELYDVSSYALLRVKFAASAVKGAGHAVCALR
jgi:hypothetical protein